MKSEPVFADFTHMLFGGDYSPEQWKSTPEIWDADMQLMQKANCNEMTMGIFSWAEIEPQEGFYDFTVLDTLMDKIHLNGGRVILATPSAARPHWLAEKYPEVLRVDAKGRQTYFGDRHNFCATSKAYRERVRIINEKLAERYANHPALLGWHISNEYGSSSLAGHCHCEKCAEKFRAWLKEKYGTIDGLNHAWWTGFWSQRFDDFSQIEPHYLEVGNQGVLGLRLDWRRFVADNLLDFMKEEMKAVRKFSDKPITTNMMGFKDGVNYKDFADEIDFVSQDIYPVWSDGVEITAKRIGLVCDYSRGLKNGKPFIVMESAPGAAAYGMQLRKIKHPGIQKLEAMKYIAHGSDSVMYFQWRKGRGGAEKLHGAIVDHYGKEDSRVFRTVSSIGAILKKLDRVAGSGVKSTVAITHDTDTRWALGHIAPSTDENGYMDTLESLYNAFAKRNIQTDVVSNDADFSAYKVVVLTVPYLMTEELAAKIKAYVKNGGIVISTYFTAMCEKNDLCVLGGVPGFGLSEVFGLRVDEVDFLGRGTQPYKNAVTYRGKRYPVVGNAEIPIADGAEVLASYTDDFYAEAPAICANKYGRGKAYYIAFENEGAMYDDFISDIIEKYGLETSMKVKADDGVCIRKREKEDKAYYFILNETEDEKKVELDKRYKDMLTDEKIDGKKTLPPYGFMILTEI